MNLNEDATLLDASASNGVETLDETGTKVTGRFNDSNMTRDTNDDVFASEFSVMMTFRRNTPMASNPMFSLPKIPVPPLPSLIKANNRTIYAVVSGVTCDYYSNLNDKFVEVSKDRVARQRKALNNGKFIMENGKPRVFDYKIDPDSYMIITPENIKRRNYVYTDTGAIRKDLKGNPMLYVDPKGYGYIDYELRNKERYYKYMIPKDKLRIANMVALVLSARPHNSAYYGYKVAFVNGEYKYLCVINYRREQNDNSTRVLGVANRVDLLPEIREVLLFWQSKGKWRGQKPFMFDTRITALPYTTGNNANNVGCMFFRGKLPMETYEPFQQGEFILEESETMQGSGV